MEYKGLLLRYKHLWNRKMKAERLSPEELAIFQQEYGAVLAEMTDLEAQIVRCPEAFDPPVENLTSEDSMRVLLCNIFMLDAEMGALRNSKRDFRRLFELREAWLFTWSEVLSGLKLKRKQNGNLIALDPAEYYWMSEVFEVG